MKCFSCLYLEATYLTFCFKKPFLLSFGGDDIIQVQQAPSDQTTAPSETQTNQHEERLFKNFTLKASMILAPSRTYQKFSSDGFDLAELEQRPVNHRQIECTFCPSLICPNNLKYPKIRNLVSTWQIAFKLS
jgi:hypothetical protein